MSTTLVVLDCNRHENGHFRGRFECVRYGNDQEMEITLRVWGSPPGMGLRLLNRNRVRISRRKFEYVSHHPWLGNWCLDGFHMKHREARRLLRYLRDSGIWWCEGGPDRLFRWFNDKRARAA